MDIVLVGSNTSSSWTQPSVPGSSNSDDITFADLGLAEDHFSQPEVLRLLQFIVLHVYMCVFVGINEDHVSQPEVKHLSCSALYYICLYLLI